MGTSYATTIGVLSMLNLSLLSLSLLRYLIHLCSGPLYEEVQPHLLSLLTLRSLPLRLSAINSLPLTFLPLLNYFSEL